MKSAIGKRLELICINIRCRRWKCRILFISVKKRVGQEPVGSLVAFLQACSAPTALDHSTIAAKKALIDKQ